VKRSSTAFVNVAMIPCARTATSVTNASPIISAAAVDAVRCGFRFVFCVPTLFAVRSGRTPGNSIGHSGVHDVITLLSHMTSTSTASTGLRSVPPIPASTRRRTPPGPHAARRWSQNGSVKKGQNTIESKTTAHVPIGLTTAASGRATLAENMATPRKIRSAPTPSHNSTWVVPRPLPNRP
jgi:hypothetical protein